MKPPIWEVFDWVQASAYPHGPMPAATCHVTRALGKLPPQLGRVLVLGPGSFHELELLRPRARELTAIMPSQAEVEQIGAHLQGVPLLLGDMHDTPFSHGAFDTIFSSNVLEHAFSTYGVLLECRRLLAQDGLLYTVVPTFETDGGGNTPWHTGCLSAAQWGELHHKAGYRLEINMMVQETDPRASFYHLAARAVTPPTPHDEALRRLIAMKG